MIRHIDAPGVIDAGSEIHYRFHRRTDPSEYPEMYGTAPMRLRRASPHLGAES